MDKFYPIPNLSFVETSVQENYLSGEIDHHIAALFHQVKIQESLEICERVFENNELLYNLAGSVLKVSMAKLLFSVLTSAILMGLTPMSHPMSSMQTMHMDEMTISYQNNMEHESADKSSAEIASFAIGCSFLVPQYACIDSFGGSKQVINGNPLAQSIYIETLTPPPKA